MLWVNLQVSDPYKMPCDKLSIEFMFLVVLTGEDGGNADGASADGSVSSGDEVLGNDSSPAPSPKRLFANIQGLSKVKG